MTISEPRFSIAFRTERLPHDEDEPCHVARLGTIVLGQHRETIVTTIGFWREDDYVASWRSAIEHLLSAPVARAALIVSVAGDDVWPFS